MFVAGMWTSLEAADGTYYYNQVCAYLSRNAFMQVASMSSSDYPGAYQSCTINPMTGRAGNASVCVCAELHRMQLDCECVFVNKGCLSHHYHVHPEPVY